MVAAYALSLVFALGYGYYAATRRTSERVMIPVLDILQSVPILGFFPVVIVLFLSLPGPTFLGPNLASVFLIFTSMSWNMVFGVYESLKTLPTELREASDTFGLRGFLSSGVSSSSGHHQSARLQLRSFVDWGMVLPGRGRDLHDQPRRLRGIGSYLSPSPRAATPTSSSPGSSCWSP